jgi:hypothetical protein
MGEPSQSTQNCRAVRCLLRACAIISRRVCTATAAHGPFCLSARRTRGAAGRGGAERAGEEGGWVGLAPEAMPPATSEKSHRKKTTAKRSTYGHATNLTVHRQAHRHRFSASRARTPHLSSCRTVALSMRGRDALERLLRVRACARARPFIGLCGDGPQQGCTHHRYSSHCPAAGATAATAGAVGSTSLNEPPMDSPCSPCAQALLAPVAAASAVAQPSGGRAEPR